MEQCDFMNPDFALIEHTDLDGEDLYKAVDVILDQSQFTETPDSSATNGVLSTEPAHFEESPLNPCKFVSHAPIDEFLQQQQNANTKHITQGDMKLFIATLHYKMKQDFLSFFHHQKCLATYLVSYCLYVRRMVKSLSL